VIPKNKTYRGGAETRDTEEPKSESKNPYRLETADRDLPLRSRLERKSLDAIYTEF
jgi:hypothetical protein